MNEKERKSLNELNRELMEASADYNDLIKKTAKIGRGIFKLKRRIDEKLDGKD